mmetsp:Transcript_10554/g.15432  ORF Transcript_10554/g.15432 Transcript_10554/m.15432 type:complete len:160 (-) Transcript_10554:1524-2003(-)
MVFHSQAMVHVNGVTNENIDDHLKALFIEEQFSIYKPLTGTHIFVCCHGNRDEGCGFYGNQVYKEFEDKTKSYPDVHVYKSTCLLSHKYAGMLTIFQGPETSKSSNANFKVIGDMYGFITPKVVPQLVKYNVLGGTYYKEFWIGRMNMKPATAPKFANL